MGKAKKTRKFAVAKKDYIHQKITRVQIPSQKKTKAKQKQN
jgi:hypothetical protein